MKLNKLLGTVALCSSLLLAVSCSTKKGFESNSAPRTTLTDQEFIMLEELQTMKIILTKNTSQLEAMKNKFSDLENEKFNELVLEGIDELKDRSDENDVKLIEYIENGLDRDKLSEADQKRIAKLEADMSAIEVRAAVTAKLEIAEEARLEEKLSDPNSKDNPQKKKKVTTVKATFDGSKLEQVPGMRDQPVLVYTKTVMVDGEEVVVSSSIDKEDINSGALADVYRNDVLIKNKKAQIICVDSVSCSQISVIIVTGMKVGKRSVFTNVDGEYIKIDEIKLIVVPEVTSDNVRDELNRDKSVHSYDEVTEQDASAFSDEVISERISELGLGEDTGGNMTPLEVRQQAIQSLLKDEEAIKERITELELDLQIQEGRMTREQARKEALDSINND